MYFDSSFSLLCVMAATYSQLMNKHGDQVYRKEMYGVEIIFADRKNSKAEGDCGKQCNT